ncbi:citramalate synthase [Tessaracoccus rhinocerotis]|uniref:Citramalate synthase n=1 Tax=Tessaracoccus rhinocerotis TaxID=1689449 RepID=A0A553JVX6_9ACTN|nr:citramalate synthase [Tessaracoccus rhinocerotis]TRY16617.1 citramalate synthase [Tessaracoccus rhinocerotis]
MTTTPTVPEEFHIFDTSLRDGAQQEGLRLSVADKLRIAGYLDELGVTFIEGGWPGANPADTQFFVEAKELELRNSKLVAFGATRKAGATAATDPLTKALVDAGTDYICIVAKSHDEHVTRALRTTLDENLEMVTDTVTYLREQGKHVFVDCEHFFDGYRANPEYALSVVRAASEAGAEVVILCDTNGGMLPSWMGDVVSAAAQTGANLGIHCHNDTGCAVANTLAAVEAGVMHVQGTFNGYGERTGNADLSAVIPNLQIKFGWELLPPANLAEITRVSHAIALVANQPLLGRQPYVGASSFAHKAGLHASAIKVDANLYQHIDPTLVGNDMRMLISDMAGRANIQIKGDQLGFDLSDRELAARVTERVKAKEAEGYSYESSDASFEMLLRDELGLLPQPFQVTSWRVFTEERHGETISEATVKITAKGKQEMVVGEGNGPVNALDHALRKAIAAAYPAVESFELTDYSVRLLDEGHGTDATVRVLINTSYEGSTWTTVGVGTNVIEASWEALFDALVYGIFTHVEPELRPETAA